MGGLQRKPRNIGPLLKAQPQDTPSSHSHSAAGGAPASLRLGSLPGQGPGWGALCMAPVGLGGRLFRLCLVWGALQARPWSFPHSRAFRALSPKACAFDLSSWVRGQDWTLSQRRRRASWDRDQAPGGPAHPPAQEELDSRLRSQARAGRSEREVGWPLGLTESKQPRW